MKSRRLKVFLCHSSNDKPLVRKLYHSLRARLFEPWFDEESLLPGQEWEQEIPKAVRNSDIVIVCLSHTSTTKAGYVQKEIRYALDVADEQPEGTIFLIPLKFESCDVPFRLQKWHWVDYYEQRGHDRLIKALEARAADLGLSTEDYRSGDASHLVDEYSKILAGPGHTFSSYHKDQIDSSHMCGCFYCLSIFLPQEITKYIDEGQTALCPRCGVDSVIPSGSGLPITDDFLQYMHEIWFKTTISPEARRLG